MVANSNNDNSSTAQEMPPFGETEPKPKYRVEITGKGRRKTVTLYRPDGSIVLRDKFDPDEESERLSFARKAAQKEPALADLEERIEHLITEKTTRRQGRRATSDKDLIVPSTAGRPLAEHFVKHSGCGRLVRWRGDWYRFTGVAYERMDQEQMNVMLREHLAKLVTRDHSESAGEDDLIGVEPSIKMLAEVIDALKAVNGVLQDSRIDAPFWLDGRKDLKPANLKVFRNGILNLVTKDLLPPTNDLFATNAVDIMYDENAPEPARWIRFLAEVFEHDPDAEKTLQEIMGYLLTSDTSLQKIFKIVGPVRGGKGTILRTLEKMIGPDNVANPTIASLSSSFGLAPLIGRQVAIIGDARIDGRTNVTVLVERLLSISGRDPMNIDRKYAEHWNGRLTTRFLMTSNSLLKLTDQAGAISTRFIVVQLDKSWLGKEDLGLDAALTAELSGIVNWALDGLDRLMNENKGHFTVTKLNQEAHDDLEEQTAPFKSFIRKHLVTADTIDRDYEEDVADWKDRKAAAAGKNEEFNEPEPKRMTDEEREIALGMLHTTGPDLTIAWEIHCEQIGVKPGNTDVAMKTLNSQMRGVYKERKRIRGVRTWIYHGVGLTNDMKERVVKEKAKRHAQELRDLWVPGNN